MTDAEVVLVGRRIVALRAMGARELEAEGWSPDKITPVLVLDDGTILFPSRDGEGNGPGALFGATALKQGFRVLAPKRA